MYKNYNTFIYLMNLSCQLEIFNERIFKSQYFKFHELFISC